MARRRCSSRKREGTRSWWCQLEAGHQDQCRSLSGHRSWWGANSPPTQQNSEKDVTLAEEMAAWLRDLETFKRMYPYEWEESIGYRELIARKADLLARIEAVEGGAGE